MPLLRRKHATSHSSLMVLCCLHLILMSRDSRMSKYCGVVSYRLRDPTNGRPSRGGAVPWRLRGRADRATPEHRQRGPGAGTYRGGYLKSIRLEGQWRKKRLKQRHVDAHHYQTFSLSTCRVNDSACTTCCVECVQSLDDQCCL